jgi:hypothetical protein
MATGWGNKTWGASEWGDLSDELVVVSSVAAQTSVNSVTTEANADVFPTTLSATFTLQGAVAGASADVFPTGIAFNIVTGNEAIGIGVPVTGSSASTNITGVTIDDQFLIGSGWGRETWGSFVWGDAYSVQTGSVSAQTAINGVTTQIDVDAAVQGQSLTITTGNELPEGDANVFPDGIAATATTGQVQALTIQGIQMNTGVGTVDIQAGGNIFVNAAENGLQTAIGQAVEIITVDVFVDGLSLTTVIGNENAFTDVVVEISGFGLSTAIQGVNVDLNTPVDVTGQQLTTAIGNEDAFTDVVVEVTGLSATFVLGDVTLVSTYEVTGNAAQTAIGTVTIEANADVNVTGISLTTAIGSPRITAWAEVNTGTQVTWTEVDLAA